MAGKKGVTDCEKNWSIDKFENADVPSYKLGRYKEIHEVLKDTVGRFTPKDFKGYVKEETGFVLSRTEYPIFFGFVEKKGEVKVRRANNGIVFGTFQERYKKYKDQIDDRYEPILDFCVGRGRSPVTILATVEYLKPSTVESGEVLAERFGISSASIFDNRDFIRENKDEFSKETLQGLVV